MTDEEFNEVLSYKTDDAGISVEDLFPGSADDIDLYKKLCEVYKMGARAGRAWTLQE